MPLTAQVGSISHDIAESEKMAEEADYPIHFRFRGETYRGYARYRTNWHHIYVTARLLRTGGRDAALALKEMSDDKYAISAEQLEELIADRSVDVKFPWEESLITVEAGGYSPVPDHRTQGQLFEE